MSQHDYLLDNQSGANFRTDLNSALAAIVTQNSGNTAPTVTYAFMQWVDTSGAFPVLKQRNAANNAWLTIGRLDLDAYGNVGVTVSATAPTNPQAGQFWADTTNALMKQRNTANNAWITLGSLDTANWGLLPLAGGTLTGALSSSNTDHWKIPVGTTAQRSGSPVNGMIRYNTDLVSFEGYQNGNWSPIGGGGYVVSSLQSISAGGTVTLSLTDNRQMRLIQGNAAPVSASATPFGTSAPKDGTEVLLLGFSDANAVTFTFNDAAKGLVGNFSTIELGKYQSIVCVYSSAFDRWIVEGGR